MNQIQNNEQELTGIKKFVSEHPYISGLSLVAVLILISGAITKEK